MTWGSSPFPPSFAPTPVPLCRPVAAPATRTAGAAPGRSSGTRRTSNRPGWRTENGRRLGVFSFFFVQPGLSANRCQSLPEQFLGTRLRQQFRARDASIHRQPRDRLHAPHHIQPFDFGVQQRRVHLLARLFAGRQKLRPPRQFPHPPGPPSPPHITYSRSFWASSSAESIFSPASSLAARNSVLRASSRTRRINSTRRPQDIFAIVTLTPSTVRRSTTDSLR